jgi:hypothetical protein
MCNPGYGITTAISSAAMMKLQQQQQMWQFHVARYQPRADAAPAGAAWRNVPSLRPMPMPPAPTTMPPQMELLCAPYQGGSRRLM